MSAFYSKCGGEPLKGYTQEMTQTGFQNLSDCCIETRTNGIKEISWESTGMLEM